MPTYSLPWKINLNLHKGIFQYNRLQFGVPSAPSILQGHMETLLQSLKAISVYIIDILICSPNLSAELFPLHAVGLTGYGVVKS